MTVNRWWRFIADMKAAGWGYAVHAPTPYFFRDESTVRYYPVSGHFWEHGERTGRHAIPWQVYADAGETPAPF